MRDAATSKPRLRIWRGIGRFTLVGAPMTGAVALVFYAATSPLFDGGSEEPVLVRLVAALCCGLFVTLYSGPLWLAAGLVLAAPALLAFRALRVTSPWAMPIAAAVAMAAIATFPGVMGAFQNPLYTASAVLATLIAGLAAWSMERAARPPTPVATTEADAEIFR